MAGMIVGLALSCVIVGVMGAFKYMGFLGIGGAFSGSGSVLSSETITKINYLESLINQKYIKYDDNLHEISASEGIYKGLISALGDQYSEYYTPEEYGKVTESINGSFEGIGATISQNSVTKEFIIAGFTNNSPAEKAGVQVGDIFSKVNGSSVAGLSLSELVGEVRGEKGTSVTIEFLRGESRENVTIDVIRDSIEANTVYTEMEDDGIGYMYINSFDKVTRKQFDEGLSSLRKDGMKKLILDLRSNPGGDLDVTTYIADMLMPKGLIVYTLDKAERKLTWESDDENALNMPMVVLVNSKSASASEVLTGALKDSGCAVIVGEKTFGKGIVQDVYSLKDGSAVKITSRKYYTPSGNNIQGIGIEPNVTVEFDSDRAANEKYDNQLEKAKEIISKM